MDVPQLPTDLHSAAEYNPTSLDTDYKWKHHCEVRLRATAGSPPTIHQHDRHTHRQHEPTLVPTTHAPTAHPQRTLGVSVDLVDLEAHRPQPKEKRPMLHPDDARILNWGAEVNSRGTLRVFRQKCEAVRKKGQSRKRAHRRRGSSTGAGGQTTLR